ncbi:MAG: hypothetical protein AABY22_27345 [Nanoarchaeota archaeon]
MDQSEQIAVENNEFQVPYDLVPLPSEGILYPNKKDTVKVEYLTASKENILTSPNLIRSGKVLNKLLEMCVKDTDIKVENLLVGDRNAIMIFLRSTGYGEMYPVKVIDPQSGEEFETKVDLSKLESKPLGAKPDENMEFDFFLPKKKKKIKFKLLTSADENSILEKSEALAKLNKNTGISTLLTSRLSRMITQVEDKRDKIYIQQFVENMPAGDSLAFRTYIDKIEPGINMEYEFESPSGSVFKQQVPINVDFFFPSS